MSTLSIVIIHKHQSTLVLQKSPAFSKRPEVSKSLSILPPEHLTKPETVVEICHSADVFIMLAFNWLVIPCVNYLI